MYVCRQKVELRDSCIHSTHTHTHTRARLSLQEKLDAKALSHTVPKQTRRLILIDDLGQGAQLTSTPYSLRGCDFGGDAAYSLILNRVGTPSQSLVFQVAATSRGVCCVLSSLLLLNAR